MFSKFKKWLNYDRLALGTATQWDEWESEYQKQAPVRYWITHTMPDVCWRPLVWRYTAVKDWIRYRTKRYHIVDTGLKPGYYDTDMLILHANFNLLKKFVEVEKASLYRWCHSSEEKPSTLQKLTRRRRKINPLDGIKYLEWETTLDAPEDPSEANPSQAASAREILELYTWWEIVRPAREELLPPEEPCDGDDRRSILYRMSDHHRQKYPDYHAAFRQWSNDHSKQEEEWNNEDTEMLIRLIKLRKSLWT